MNQKPKFNRDSRITKNIESPQLYVRTEGNDVRFWDLLNQTSLDRFSGFLRTVIELMLKDFDST